MKITPVLFVVGPDPFQVRLLLTEIRQAFGAGSDSPASPEMFDLKDTPLSQVLDAANTLPMFQTRRLIFVRNAGDPSDQEQDAWIDYLKNPATHSCIVGISEKLDRRSRLSKALEKEGAVRAADPPAPRDYATWIDRLARNRGVRVDPPARPWLLQLAERGLADLDGAIEKMSLYVHPATTITEEVAREFALQSIGGNVFQWTDHVTEGKWREATLLLHQLLADGTPPLVLLTMLARHLRILLKAKTIASSPGSRSELPAILGVPPFLVDRYLSQSRLLTPKQLLEALRDVQRTDRDLKSTGLPPTLLVEKLVRGFAN